MNCEFTYNDYEYTWPGYDYFIEEEHLNAINLNVVFETNKGPFKAAYNEFAPAYNAYHTSGYPHFAYSFDINGEVTLPELDLTFNNGAPYNTGDMAFAEMRNHDEAYYGDINYWSTQDNVYVSNFSSDLNFTKGYTNLYGAVAARLDPGYGQYERIPVIDYSSLSVCPVSNYNFAQNFDYIPSVVMGGGFVKSKFNGKVKIGNGVTNMSCMFWGCGDFNRKVIIPNRVTTCFSTFFQCTNFNQSVTIPNSVNDCRSMFCSCNNFNSPVTIPQHLTGNNCDTMFLGCLKFNQPVTIPNGLNSCYAMFTLCTEFNQPVVIPSGVSVCQYMFGACFNLNSTVVIPHTLDYCNGMFAQCVNFNQPVTVPHCNDLSYMFDECRSFNQPVTIPNDVDNVEYMFGGYQTRTAPIYIPSDVYSYVSDQIDSTWNSVARSCIVTT